MARDKIIDSEPSSLNKNAIEIRKYIALNPGVTENKVSKYLETKHICSRLTTLKEVKRLITSGILEDRKEGNSFHHLHVSNKNEFSHILKKLSEIETVLNSLNQKSIKIFRDTAEMKPNFEDVQEYLRDGYVNSIDNILHILLLRTYNSKLSREDSQELYTRITRLILKISRHWYINNRRRLIGLLNQDVILLKGQRGRLFHFANEHEFENINEVTVLLDKFVATIQDFNTRYLETA